MLFNLVFLTDVTEIEFYLLTNDSDVGISKRTFLYICGEILSNNDISDKLIYHISPSWKPEVFIRFEILKMEFRGARTIGKYPSTSSIYLQNSLYSSYRNSNALSHRIQTINTVSSKFKRISYKFSNGAKLMFRKIVQSKANRRCTLKSLILFE